MRGNQIKNCNFAQKYKKNKMRKEYAEKLNGTTIEIGCSNENDKNINLTEYAGLLFHVEGNKLIPDITEDILEDEEVVPDKYYVDPAKEKEALEDMVKNGKLDKQYVKNCRSRRIV